MLLAPAANVAVFELGRRGTDGPLVDGIHLDTTYGVLALILGRGFFALIGLVPMVLGATYGAALARRLAPVATQPARRRRRGAAGRHRRADRGRARRARPVDHGPRRQS
jgi:hypothetical protein